MKACHQTFIKHHSVIQRRSQANLFRESTAQSRSFAHVGPQLGIVITIPGITVPLVHLSSCGKGLWLSCSLAQALTPFKSAVECLLQRCYRPYNYLITLHHFESLTLPLTCALRTVHLITLKNLIYVDVAKIMASQVLSFT